MIREFMRGTALASALALPFLCSGANAQIAVSANDNKIALVDGANTVPANPPPDTVTILDIGVSPPKVLGEVQAPSSVVGVPQSVAVSKDESFAIVTSAMKVDPADPKKTTPDDRVSVIDLKANPPAVTQTLQAGAGVTGVSINPAGTLALTANRNDGSRVDLHDQRQDTHAGRQGRFRQQGLGAEPRRIPARRQVCDRHARRRSPGVDPVDRRQQGRGHQEVHGRRLPALQPRRQPEGRCRGVRQSGRRAGRQRPDQRRRSEDQLRRASSRPFRSARRRRASRWRRTARTSP